MGIDQILSQIISKAPVLRTYLTREDSIENVSKELLSVDTNDKHLKRQRIYRKKLQSKIDKIFSSEEKKKIHLNFENGIVANTVDHLGIINHPAMISAYFTMGYSRIFSDKKSDKDLLILSTTAIPLNDYFHRRGFDLGGKHINVTSKNDRNKLLFIYPKVEFDIIGKLKKTKEINSYSEKEIALLENIQKIMESINYTACEDYADQLTKINFYLWKHALPIKIRESAPNLLTLNTEHIEVNYLIELIEEKDSFIYDLLFDANNLQIALQTFNGTTGAWDNEKGSGTHFFWKIENGYLEKLYYNNSKLVDKDRNFSIELKPEIIREALEQRRIFPSMLLTYGITVFWAGVKSLAGYGSVQYVTNMKNCWIEYLTKIGDPEVNLLKEINTSHYSNSSINFSRVQGKLVPDYAFDLMLQGGKSLSYYDQIKKMPYKYLQYPVLKNMYEYYISASEKIEIDDQEFFKPFAWIN